MGLSARVLDTASSSESLLGGLDGGYVITQNGSGLPSGTIKLIAADDLGTTVDSSTLTNTFPAETCANNAGDVYLLTSAGSPGSTTTRTLRKCSQSGGTLSVTSVGSFTMAASATALDGSWLDADDSQVLVQYAGTAALSAVNTGTGALDWTSTLTGHSVTPLACMGGDRILVACATHSDIELWDGATPTLLDSLARDSARSATEVIVPLTTTTALYAIMVSSTSPDTLRVGVLSTASDTLSWAWGTTDHVTAWTGTSPADPGVSACAWGTTGALGPASRVYASGYKTVPLYLVNGTTGVISATEADSSVGYGAYPDEFWWAGSGTFVVHDAYLYATLTSWSTYRTGPTYLRQRQSPKRAPSRVRGVDLRQRQSPRITG